MMKKTQNETTILPARGLQPAAARHKPQTKRTAIALALLTFTATLAAWNCRADDLFRLYWRGTVYKNNPNTGRIVSHQFTEQNFVNQVAQNNGLNPNDLVFVFRPNKRDTAVVFKNNGAFVADVIQFGLEGYPGSWTDVVSPRGKYIVRGALLYDEYHDQPLGEFFGTEQLTPRPSGGVKWDSLTGNVHYSYPDQGKIFTAHISTGDRVRDTSGG